MSSESGRRISWSSIVVVVAGVLVLVVLTLCVAWMRSRAHLNAQLAQLRASGDPITPQEANAFYAAPSSGPNTTQLWLAAIVPLGSPQFQAGGKALPFVGDAPNEVPLPGEPWELLDPAEQFLQAWSASRDRLHLVARQVGEARFPLDFSLGLSMPLPHLQQLRAAARLLALETAVAAHRGQTDAAVEAVVALFAAARAIEQEPILVSQLVRMAIDGMARQQVRWLLSASTLDEPQLARLDAELARSDFHHAVQRALTCERAMGIQVFDDLGSVAGELAGGFRLTPTSDEIVYLQLIEQMIAAFDETGPTRRQAVDDAARQVAFLSNQTGATVRFPLSRLLLPSLQAVSEACSRNEADRDATRVAIAIERFYLRHGKLPSTLDELVPEFLKSLPEDPYVGAPLHYRVDAPEYVVYSVGANGSDDGGASEPLGNAADIVVRVRRKANSD